MTDWTRFRWPRPITMTSVRTSNLPSITFPVANAFRGKCSYRIMQATNGAYVRPEATYLIPKDPANSGGAGPFKPGDLLTDPLEVDATDSNPHSPDLPEQIDAVPVTYTVQLVENDEFYYLLAVFNPKITFNLRDTVDIVLNTTAISDILTRQTTASDVSTGVICRRQPVDIRMNVLSGHQDNDKIYDVFFATNQTLLPDRHVLRWTEGATTIVADIESVTNAGRIDELQRARVVVK